MYTCASAHTGEDEEDERLLATHVPRHISRIRAYMRLRMGVLLCPCLFVFCWGVNVYLWPQHIPGRPAMQQPKQQCGRLSIYVSNSLTHLGLDPLHVAVVGGGFFDGGGGGVADLV